MAGPSTEVNVKLQRVVSALVVAVVFLVLANIGVNFIKLVTGDKDLHGIIPMFELKSERNIPTFFSGLLFVFDSVLLGLVWLLTRNQSRRNHVWMLLTVLFLFLAFDEMFQVHEQLIDPIRARIDATGVLYFAWFLGYGIGVVVLASIFLPIWWRLEKDIRWLLALSAVIYLTGAVGFEMLGGVVYEATNDQGGPLYAVLYTIEETLEMVGLVLLAYTLIRLIGSHTGALRIVFDNSAQVASQPAQSIRLPGTHAAPPRNERRSPEVSTVGRSDQR